MLSANMKNRKKNLPFILIFILIIISCFYILILKKEREPNIHRFQLPSLSSQTKGTLKIRKCELNWDYPHVYFIDGGQKSTFLGSVFDSPGNHNQLELKPRLQGQFILDFFICALPVAKDKIISRTQLIKLRSNKVINDSILRSDKNLKRFQVLLTLQKEDIVVVHLPSATRGFVTNPIFYKYHESPEKNFVFLIVADTLRYDDIGVYNQKVNYTPAIDQFAKDSTVFTQAYSTSSWTLPAHASMFTGLFCTTHNINHRETKLGNNILPLTKILQDKFITYSINGNGFLSSLYGFAQGFDFYKEDPVDHLIRQASEILFKRARKLVNNEKHDFSFFFLHTYQIHAPYLPENKLFRELYRDSVKENQYDFKELIQDRKNLYKRVEDPEKDRIKKIYNGGVYTFDFHFGKFIEYLKQKKIYQNSTIILTSDHGEEFLDHGAWLHGHSLYNELIKIPIILKLPDSKSAGQENKNLVCITDLLPTIIEYYNLKVDKKTKIDGLSMLEINSKDQRYIISYLGKDAMQKHLPKKISIISNNYKLIFNESMSKEDLKFFLAPPPDEKTYQLFDIQRDPFEKFNIINTKAILKKRFINIINTINLQDGKGKKVNIEELKKSLETLGYI